MPVQHKYRSQPLALAIVLALGCAEFSHAQQETAVSASSPVEVAEQPNAELKGDPLARLLDFIGANDTATTVIDSPESVIKKGDGNDLVIVKNGGSFKGRADGGGGTNVIHLDASDRGELGDTRNFNGLYSSQGSWTLTSKGDFKEGVVVLNDAVLSNNGKIQGGALVVGQLFNKGDIKGHVEVEDGGTFFAGGTVGSLGVHGAVNVSRLHGAPKIRGDLSLSETAVLAYEVNPDGSAETIKVGGTASLGGATLKIVAIPGEYPQSSQHTIIEAKKVEGEFGKVLHNLAFMEPTLQYTNRNVGLTYARNDVSIASLATSGNGLEFGNSVIEPQIVPQTQTPFDGGDTVIAEARPSDVAAPFSTVPESSAAASTPAPASQTSAAAGSAVKAAQSITPASTSAAAQKATTTTNAAITALLASNRETASLALEQLAGSSNANLAKATLSSVDPVNGSLLSAMRQLDSTHSASNLRERNNAPRRAAGSENNGRVWVQALGHGGNLDREVEPLQHSTKGLLIGADWDMDEEWHLGVMAGKSRTRLDSQELDGGLDSWHLGAYALRQSGPMSIRMGATYSNHDGNTARRVAFTGFNDRPKGRYDASTQQGFAEVGYNLGSANISIEPFASLGFQRYQRDGYTEKGGAAALKVHERTQSNMNSTVGLRLAKVDTLNNGMRLTPRFSAGWKQTYGETYTKTRQRLVTGGRNYTAYGVELDRNSLLIDAGLDLGVATNHSVGVGLTSEFGTDSRNHGVMGQWRMAF